MVVLPKTWFATMAPGSLNLVESLIVAAAWSLYYTDGIAWNELSPNSKEAIKLVVDLGKIRC